MVHPINLDPEYSGCACRRSQLHENKVHKKNLLRLESSLLLNLCPIRIALQRSLSVELSVLEAEEPPPYFRKLSKLDEKGSNS
jgi:hypothetical protein